MKTYNVPREILDGLADEADRLSEIIKDVGTGRRPPTDLDDYFGMKKGMCRGVWKDKEN